MQGRADISGFISAFTGDDRYIIDYLVEEVLQRQSEDVQSFLLQTSILQRLSGPLCNAVTGRETGQAMLETLERANLFVVPLDDKRRWYRYHQLSQKSFRRARWRSSQTGYLPCAAERAERSRQRVICGGIIRDESRA
jgi:LuxR family maltose regulon positive regulatory protein